MFGFVSEVMSRCPVLVAADLPVVLVAAVMRRETVNTVVVGTRHHPAGVLTAMDIVVRVTAAGADPHTVTAGDICADLSVTTAPDEELLAALTTMQVHELQVLPVLTHDEVVGLLTPADLGLAVWRTLKDGGRV